MSRGRTNMTIKEKNQAMKTETVVTTLWSTRLPYRLTRYDDNMNVIMISMVSGQKAIGQRDVRRKHMKQSFAQFLRIAFNIFAPKQSSSSQRQVLKYFG